MWASTGIAPVTVDTICFDRLTLKMVIAPEKHCRHCTCSCCYCVWKENLQWHSFSYACMEMVIGMWREVTHGEIRGSLETHTYTENSWHQGGKCSSSPYNWSESSRGVTIDTRPVPFEYKIPIVLKSGTVPVS